MSWLGEGLGFIEADWRVEARSRAGSDILFSLPLFLYGRERRSGQSRLFGFAERRNTLR